VARQAAKNLNQKSSLLSFISRPIYCFKIPLSYWNPRLKHTAAASMFLPARMTPCVF